MADVSIKLKSLYPWQREIVDAKQRHKLVICSRRAGKTEVAKHIAIKELLAGRRALWIAPFHWMCKDIWADISATLAPLISESHKNHDITLKTGGTILFKSGDDPQSLRSTWFHLAVIDEAAFCHADCWTVLRPSLSDKKGKALFISTPNGLNWLHQFYLDRSKEPTVWYVCQRPYVGLPRPDEAEVQQAKNEMTPAHWRQEFMAEFLQPSGAIFPAEWLDPKKLFVNAMPTEYVIRSCITADMSLGRLKSDYQAVACLMVVDPIVYVDMQAGRMPVQECNKRIKDLYERYRPEGVVFETNGFQELCGDDFRRLFKDENLPVPPTYGVNNSVNKQTRISRLSTLLSLGHLRILDNPGGRLLHRQLCDFPVGDFDDTCDSLEQGWRFLCTPPGQIKRY